LGTRICTPAVTQECVVTGWRNTQCVDKTIVSTLYPGGVIPTPVDLLPDACYRCVEEAHCSSNGTYCRWTFSLYDCINTCLASLVNNTDPCATRSPCECLSNPVCSWCQFDLNVTSSAVTKTISAGRCMHNTLANKCEAQYEAGGFVGSLIRVKPPACNDSTASPQLTEPTAVLQDLKLRALAAKIISGAIQAIDIQAKLAAAGITDVIVKEIISVTTDSNSLNFTMTFDVLSSRTGDQASSDISVAIAAHLQIDASSVSTIALTLNAGPVSKRSIPQTGNSFAGSSSIIPNSPSPQPVGNSPAPQQIPTGYPINGGISSAYFLAPSVWLVSLFLVFLKGRI